jgi:hypothetical protein
LAEIKISVWLLSPALQASGWSRSATEDPGFSAATPLVNRGDLFGGQGEKSAE